MKDFAAFAHGFAVDAALAAFAALCLVLAVIRAYRGLRIVATTVLVEVRHRNLNRMLFVAAIVGACLYGGAKNGDACSSPGNLGSNESRSQTRTEVDAIASDENEFSFTSFSMASNMATFGLSWRTNFSPGRAWIELYEKLHSLTNPWLPRLVREMPSDATNDAFSVSFTNGAPSAAFYSARVDALHVDFPGLEMTEDATGRRVYTSFGSRTFAVSVSRSERSGGYPPPDPAFAVNPFAHVAGLTYDPNASTLTAEKSGEYDLPDGSVLAVFASEPKASFGTPHGYAGTTLSYASGSYAMRSPYPLSTPSLQRGWSRGTTPGSGCACVPSVDFGGGLVVRDSSRAARQANGQGLPAGMWTDFDYGDGGVWITLYNHTNVIWRGWCAHRWYGDTGGTSDGLGGPQDEDECGCGDQDSLEGSSAGSVRFRIPLGSAHADEVSGFLYFNRDVPFDVTPSAFELLSRGDSLVDDAYGSDGSRTVVCRDSRGRTLVLRGNESGDGVDIEVRDTASDDLQHTWSVTRDGQVIRIAQTSVLDNTMQDKSYVYDAGEWIETDNISGLSERRVVQDGLNSDGTLREERVVTCAGKVAIDVVTTSQRFGTGTNAVLRETLRRELGANASWKESHASYWDDVQHPRRHGSLRLEYGDDRAWSYRAHDDEGRVVFRLDQRDGSPVPADSPDYSITNLPSAAAFATTYDYTPLFGDDNRSNDWKKVRTETKYVVAGGEPVLIARTWKTYARGTSDGYPTIVVTTERAGSQTAQQGDAGNAISVSAVFDDESADVPYVLRGELAEETDEDGVTTRFGRSDVRGVLRTVERKFFNGNEFKTRRVTERDWNYGNLLYEARAIAEDGAEFDWQRHSYDEKNRLRSTQYADGSWETNAYSCCRLLWTIDRTGAKRIRSAQTGTDRLFYAQADEYVKDLPKDSGFYDDAWHLHVTFVMCFPNVLHCCDGLGRETNVITRSSRYYGGDVEPTVSKYGYVHRASVDYPSGVSDFSVSTDARGLRTVRRTHETASARIECTEEFEPESSVPAKVMTNVVMRGGGEVMTRGQPGCLLTTAVWQSYSDDGTKTEYETAADDEGVCVTNRICSYDFLGRVQCDERPGSSRHHVYYGASSRIRRVEDAASGVVTEPMYDADGSSVGQLSCGVGNVSLADYVQRSNAWWKTETSYRCANGVTNGLSVSLHRLTGIGDDCRAERLEYREGVLLRHTATSFDAAEGTETETVDDATMGRNWTKSRFGLPIEIGTPLGTIANFYGPTGRVFTRKRTSPSGGQMQMLDCVCVNGLGDVVDRQVADRHWIDEMPCSSCGYDCRGNLAAITNELGEVVCRSYDVDGNMTEQTGDAYPVRWHYDVRGNRAGLDTMRTGPDWDSTSWEHDPATGACLGKTYADDSQMSYAQTLDGLPLRTTQPDGCWTENLYDANRWLVGQTSSDASCVVQYANDAFGRPVSAVTTSAAYAWELSSDGVATNELATVGDETCEIVRRLDAYGRVVSLSDDGSAKTFVFYAPNGLIACVSNDDCVVRYDYDALGNDMGHTQSLSNGTTFVRTLMRNAYLRDEILSVVNVCGEATNAYAYTYDVLHRPVSRNADTFAYNRRGEVTNEVVSGVARSHAYDFIGNEQPANCLNQYLGLGYSANGELISDGEYTYSYDAHSRLTAAYRDGVLVVSNRYDHLGRRVVKVAADGTHTFFYDGWKLIREIAAKNDGTTNRIEYVWGKDLSGTLDGAAGIGGLLYVKIDGAIFVPFYDAYGNVMEYRNAAGVAVASYVYDAFGKAVAQSGPMTNVFRMRYSTKYYDDETGLYYYGKRFYSPEWRRWTTRDPIEELGGVNLYGFCVNNANCRYDSTGLSAFSGPNVFDQFGSSNRPLNEESWFEQNYAGWISNARALFIKEIESRIDCSRTILKERSSRQSINPGTVGDWIFGRPTGGNDRLYGDNGQNNWSAACVLGQFAIDYVTPVVVTYEQFTPSKKRYSWSTTMYVEDVVGLQGDEGWIGRLAGAMAKSRRVKRAQWVIGGFGICCAE